MSVADDILSALQDFAHKLESGERIMVTTIEQCPCQKDATTFTVHSEHQKVCSMCNGSGWLHDAKTLFGD